jgi:ribosomal protein S18 acetylase RimI-like enzyme
MSNIESDILLKLGYGESAASPVIRPLKPQDREHLIALLIETEVFTREEMDIAIELIDIVLTDPDQKDYIIYVYDEGYGPVGYYCIGPTPATDATFDLYWIAVKPTVQSNGIGRKLNEHAEALIRSRGGRLVIAETSSLPLYEKTHRFYQAQGYTQLSRIRDYYRQGDDLVVYGKYLS